MPKVSVVMPSFNVAPYIKECMDSVVNQTLKDIEIIVVDAFSTDGTREILQEYASRDSRITILNDDKGSTGYSNNIAMDLAKGEYIGIVETDDFVEPDMFEKLYSLAAENNCDIVKGNYYSFSGNGKDRVYVKHNMLSRNKYDKILNIDNDENIFDHVMFNWAGIYRKEFLKKYNIRHQETPGASFQDNGFFFQAFAFAERVYFTQESFYRYRKDNPNSSINNPAKIFCMCDEYDYVKDCLMKYPEIWEKVFYRYLRRRYGACSWTLKKAAPQHRNMIAERMQKDFKALIKNEDEIEKIQPKKQYRIETELLLNDVDEYIKNIFKNQDRYPRNISRFCDKVRGRDILIFGCGECGTAFDDFLIRNGIKAKCYVDNNINNQGKVWNQKKILSLKDADEKYPDGLFVITPALSKEVIKKQIIDAGIDETRIINYNSYNYIWD